MRAGGVGAKIAEIPIPLQAMHASHVAVICDMVEAYVRAHLG